MKKITTATFLEMKRNGEKITLLTAYDAPTAALLNEAGVEGVLVGDSVGNVKLGYEDTLPVTIEDMIHHTKAAKRGNSNALLIADMPYLSYHLSVEQAKENAGRLVKEGGAEAVKIEGGKEAEAIARALTGMGIPVMGHLGLMPQSIEKLGGYKMQGKTEESARQILEDALLLQDCGVFAVVLECIPSELGKKISQQLSIPTIGIGAGPDCDGQVLVIDDMLGLTRGHVPKFVKVYAELRKEMLSAVERFKDDVRGKKFPHH